MARGTVLIGDIVDYSGKPNAKMTVEDRGKRVVRWLHISDFHFQEGDPYDRDVVLRQLTADVPKFCDQGRQPDLIFATGDIAYKGHAKEYVQAATFFDTLLEATGLDKRRLFVVPGNHDVNRKAGQGLERTLSSEDKSSEFFGPNHPQYHFQKLAEFRKWYDGYFSGVRVWPEHSTCQAPEVVEVSGLSVGVLSLNSALFCLDNDDNGKLWIGRRCLDDAVAALDALAPDLRIALMHHPLDWLHDGERSNIRAKLHEKVDFILRGHLHETEVEDVVSPTGGALHIAAGACYQTRKYPNRALFVHVTFKAGRVRVFPISYQDTHNRGLDRRPESIPTRTALRGCISAQVAVKQVGTVAHQE